MLDSIRQGAARDVNRVFTERQNGRAGTPRAGRLSHVLLRVERLLGGDEPSSNLSARGLAALKKAREKPPTAEQIRAAAERVEARESGSEFRTRVHEFDNKKPIATCAAADGRGKEVVLLPSGDPFDRAHNTRDPVGMLRPAATGGKRMRPITLAQFHSVARLHAQGMLRSVKIRVTEIVDGEELLTMRVCDVGPDSQVELQAEYAAKVAAETGTNLFGGNMARAVRAVLERGGEEHVKKKRRRIKE